MVDEEKKFAQVGKLKPGNYVLIDGFPCKIMSFEKSKPGKHGAAKARIVAMGVFDNQKRNLLKSTGDEVEVPVINRSNGQVVAVMGDIVQVMDTETYVTFDVPKPKDISGLASGADVEYIQYGNNVKIIRKK